ncbi:MAG: phosphatidate cytidylyltransferase [Betaproteobacteria bacterium]|nr:phosphatidate cytidylyltransferase [Betaproteobacteria bacterium]
MLKTRVITAVVLLAVFLSALFFLPPLGWAWFVALVAAIAGWEWGGLLRLSPRGKVACGVVVFGACAAAIVLLPEAISLPSAIGGTSLKEEMERTFHGWSEAWQFGRWFYLPSAIFWCVLAPLWLWRRWKLPMGRSMMGGFFFGLILILPTWLALVQLRNLFSPSVLLATMAIVWVADTTAYFSGRAFGKRKLAPSISPGKTWAGAWGAVVGVLVYGAVIAAANGSSGLDLALTLINLICLTALSIIGDLFESLLKRQAEIKDSSAILPGHGGVLDRIDSLTSTLPVVALLLLSPFVTFPG